MAPRGEFLSIMLWSSCMQHYCCIREDQTRFDEEFASKGALSIAVSAPFLSYFAMFRTCFCTVRLCYRDEFLTCLATGVKLLVSDDETSYGRRSVAGEAPENHANPQYLNDATCHEDRGHG